MEVFKLGTNMTFSHFKMTKKPWLPRKAAEETHLEAPAEVQPRQGRSQTQPGAAGTVSSHWSSIYFGHALLMDWIWEGT